MSLKEKVDNYFKTTIKMVSGQFINIKKVNLSKMKNNI